MVNGLILNYFLGDNKSNKNKVLLGKVDTKFGPSGQKNTTGLMCRMGWQSDSKKLSIQKLACNILKYITKQQVTKECF